MLVLKGLEFNSNVLKCECPLLLQIVVFLKTSAHVSLIVLVVLGDLRLALLKHLHLEATLAWPLLAQVLIQLLHRLVLQLFYFSLDFMTVIDFL